MTAGSGILHIETPPEELVISGGRFHGLQLWVNLPSRDKMIAPRYQNLDGDLVTLLSSPDGGALVRLIAGDIAGHHGPGSTHTPIVVAHLTLSPGAQITLPWQRDFNALAYVLSGRGTAGAEAAPVQLGQLAVFGAGDTITLTAAANESLDVYLLGGRPIGEPVAAYGPFVMNTRDELAQAFEDFQAGRLGTIPAGGLMPYHPDRAPRSARRRRPRRHRRDDRLQDDRAGGEVEPDEPGADRAEARTGGELDATLAERRRGVVAEAERSTVEPRQVRRLRQAVDDARKVVRQQRRRDVAGCRRGPVARRPASRRPPSTPRRSPRRPAGSGCRGSAPAAPRARRGTGRDRRGGSPSAARRG